MKWSIRLGRFAGVDVYLHVTFILFLAFIGASQMISGRSVRAAFEGVAFFCAVFACVLLHEFGHALAARRFGVRTRDITLLPIGGVARLERMPERPLQELWVALAGPAVNVGIAVILSVWLLVARRGFDPEELDLTRGTFAPRLLLVNVVLVLFNLIPAFPMDGGRVLRAILALRMDYSRATQIAASLGQGIALIFAMLGLMGLLRGSGNPLLLFIALFVWIGASQEAGMAQFRSTLNGACVRDAMLTSYFALSPQDTLGRVVELVMAGCQQDFPVVEGRRVVGLLTRQRLVAALAEHGRSARVISAMDENFAVLDAGAPLESVLASAQGRALGLVPVLERGELVGLLTWENLSEYVLIQSALRAPRPASAAVPPVLRT